MTLAAWCGLVGFKPAWGRVPTVIRPNAFAGTDPFVAEGPIGRTVADAALVLQTLSGVDSRDPYSLPDTPDFLAALGGDLRGRRSTWSPDFGVYPVDPAVAAAAAAAVLLRPPAASIPAGLIDGRLPVGMQIIGGATTTPA